MVIFNAKEFASRLLQERKRLKMSRESLALALGSHANTIARYERGETSPDMAALVTLMASGFDIGFVLNGERRDRERLPADYEKLLTAYEETALHDRAALLAMCQTFAATHPLLDHPDLPPE